MPRIAMLKKCLIHAVANAIKAENWLELGRLLGEQAKKYLMGSWRKITSMTTGVIMNKSLIAMNKAGIVKATAQLTDAAAIANDYVMQDSVNHV